MRQMHEHILPKRKCLNYAQLASVHMNIGLLNPSAAQLRYHEIGRLLPIAAWLANLTRWLT